MREQNDNFRNLFLKMQHAHRGGSLAEEGFDKSLILLVMDGI